MPDILTMLAGTALGAGAQAINNGMQLSQQDALNAQQAKWNNAQTNHNEITQLDLWNKTGYQGQMDQMKAAGLNPALMYAKGGQGGSTQANTVNQAAPQSGKSTGMEISQGMQNAMQLELLKAQKENIEADTRNKEAQGTKTTTVDIPNVAANTELTKTNTANAQIDNAFKTQSLPNAIEQVNINLQNATQDLESKVRNNTINRETMDSQMKQIREQAVQTGLQNLLIKANTNLSQVEANQKAQQILQEWQQLNINQQNATTNKLNASTNANNQQTNQYNADTNRQSLAWQKLMHDVADSTKISVDGVKQLFSLLGAQGWHQSAVSY